MNNKDLLNKIHSRTDTLEPTDRLSPDSVEELLGGVKRKSYKGVISACTTLCVLCAVILNGFYTLGNHHTNPTIPVKNNSNAQSYTEVYKAVNTIKEQYENEYKYALQFNTVGDTTVDAIPESSVDISDSVDNSLTLGSSAENTSTEHSDTNIQVKGVDEADVVKTDGKYIYSIYDEKIYISEANNGNPKLISTIDINSDKIEHEHYEMYIYNNILAVVANSYTATEEASDDIITNSIDYSTICGGYLSNSQVTVMIFDLSDKENPKEISNLTQSGRFTTTRKIDNVLYITSGYSINNYSEIDKDNPETYCPTYNANGTTNCVPAEAIVITEDIKRITYTTISSIDLNSPDDFADMCSILGSNENVYASKNNMYVTCKQGDKTRISRFSIDGTEIEENGTFVVDGYLLDQFSMDEHNGYFRVVTEVYNNSDEMYDVVSSDDSSTSLYVFDSNLELTGKIENVAQGEYVKSVRFDGDIAYFVTFRQTDPLFTVDLSNPNSPKILSELKIPGFSEYLHPFGDNLLLGFGREADIDTGRTEGLKLTMFDVADKTNAKELATLVFADDSSYSAGEYNHKAIFIDQERNLIGIPYITYTHGTSDAFIKSYYHIFKYDEESKKFVSFKKIELSEDTPWEDLKTECIRGLYIGDYFYIVAPYEIYSYNYNNFDTAGYIDMSKEN